MTKAVTIAVGIAFAVSAVQAGEPGGTPDALFFSEAAVGATVGVAFFVAGYAVGGDPADNTGTSREKASYGVYGATPLAAALGIYFIGENVGQRSANRGVLLLATAGTFCGLIGGAGALGYALTEEDKDAGALNGAFYSIIPAAFAAAAVYNAVKEPYFYEIPGYSLRLEPTVGVCRGGESGEPVATCGVEVWF
jgi:hypothetical protein